VQFFTWFALFCMWLYFVPAVATGVFHGQTLGVRDAGVETVLQSKAGAPFIAQAVAVARAYEARKKELAAEAERTAAPHPWYNAVLQMLGLKPAAPDPGERIDAKELESMIATHLSVSSELPKEETESPLVRSFAAALSKHTIAAPNSPEVAAEAADIHSALAAARRYQQGAAWGGVCFSAYNGTAFVFAFALLALVKRFSARSIHRVCLACGGGGLILAVTLHEQYLLIGSMVLVGVAWASILSMPYAMLANAIPAQKMGFYMGVFNFFIVIPQILASLGLGTLMTHGLGNNPMNAVLLGGGSMLVAALCVGLVSKDVDSGTGAASL
jgi:hypothetical protein